MNKILKKEWERLSAYLDGESADPDADREWVQSDPRLSGLRRSYEDLSSGLKRMPTENVSPAFRTRVMAEVRDTRPSSAVSWWKPATLVFSTVIAVVVAVSWFAMRPSPTTNEWVAATDADAIEGILIEKLAEVPSESIEGLESSYSDEEIVWEEPDISNDLNSLLAEINDVLDQEMDMDGLLASLTEAERLAFKEILIDDATEELEI